jgi:hypothetical protein
LADFNGKVVSKGGYEILEKFLEHSDKRIAEVSSICLGHLSKNPGNFTFRFPPLPFLLPFLTFYPLSSLSLSPPSSFSDVLLALVQRLKQKGMLDLFWKLVESPNLEIAQNAHRGLGNLSLVLGKFIEKNLRKNRNHCKNPGIRWIRKWRERGEGRARTMRRGLFSNFSSERSL